MREYGFSLTFFSHIQTESTIMSLYGRKRSVKTRIVAYFIKELLNKKKNFLSCFYSNKARNRPMVALL